MDVIIIGAPRSGTNMLRDALTSLPGFVSWDCDEINLVWRHGNADVPHDELAPEQATADVSGYLGRRFERLRRRRSGDVVVEKTCANSLRVGFVDRARPDARFVWITRDGLDAASSAMARWHAPLEVRYTLAKMRHAPWSDLPRYGAGRVVQRFGRPGRAAAGHGWWGPRPRDWRDLSVALPLDEVCLTQWQRCVDAARRDLARLPADRVHHVAYEDFVGNPVDGLRGILAFLGREERFAAAAVAGVSAGSVGRGRARLPEADRRRLQALARPTLESLGHDG